LQLKNLSRLKSNPIAQLFGQTSVYGLGIVLPRLLNYLLLTPFYTRVFPKAEYGIITELYAYVVFLIVILTYGLETGYFRFASNSSNKKEVYSSALISLFTTTSIFFLGVILFRHPIALFLGYGNHPEYIAMLAAIVALDALTALPFARIRLENKAFKYTIIRLVEVIVNISLNWFFLYYAPRNVESLPWIASVYNPEIGVGYVLVSNLFASLLKLILLTGDLFAVSEAKFDFTLLKSILKYSFPLLIAGLAGTINEALDRVLLKHLTDSSLNPMEQLGVYGANYKIAVLMTLFVQMFKYAAEPFFFSKSGKKDSVILYADVMKYFVIAGLIIFLFVLLYIDYFVLFIGKDFREGIGIVPVILMANLIMGMFFNLSIWYKLTNKTMIGAWLVIIGASITIILNTLFIPEYGYFASAWAHLICYSVMLILSFWWSRKYMPIPYDIKTIAFYFLLVVSVYFINRISVVQSLVLVHVFRLLSLVLVLLIIFFVERTIYRKKMHIEKI